MRSLVDPKRIRAFLKALSREAQKETRLYLTGGATAVLRGWRPSTVDIDVLIVPESDRMLRRLPQLKEELQINVELACPAHFIPEIRGWEDRSLFEEREGKLSVYHYDPYSQALAKIERGHAQDLKDVEQMVQTGLVVPAKLQKFFDQIEGSLYKYPSIDPASFRKAVEKAMKSFRAR